MRNGERGIFKTGISLKMETLFVVILINEMKSVLFTAEKKKKSYNVN